MPLLHLDLHAPLYYTTVPGDSLQISCCLYMVEFMYAILLLLTQTLYTYAFCVY